MVCGRVSNLLSAYLDRELTGADMLAVRRHLADCAACRAEHEALASVRRLLGSLPAVEPRPGSRERFLRHVSFDGSLCRRTVRREALQAAGLWTLPPRQPRWSLWAGLACAVLAGSLLLTGISRPRPADTVVAIIRPEIGPVDTSRGYDPRLASYFWPSERVEMVPEWQRERGPSFQLVGLRQGW